MYEAMSFAFVDDPFGVPSDVYYSVTDNQNDLYEADDSLQSKLMD